MQHRSHAEVYYHFVWATKHRAKTITKKLEPSLFQMLRKKCAEHSSTLIEVNCTDNHIHVLLRAYTCMSPAQIAKELKGSSSFHINKNCLTDEPFSWQDGYGVFSVSPHDVGLISRYIANQKKHHAVKEVSGSWEICSDSADGVG